MFSFTSDMAVSTQGSNFIIAGVLSCQVVLTFLSFQCLHLLSSLLIQVETFLVPDRVTDFKVVSLDLI